MSRWYRAYEGTCADPKLHEAAMVAGVSRSIVIATWHLLLESCASNEGVGEFEISPRRIAVILGETVETIEAVLFAFGDIGLISDGCVPSWNKRQFVSDRDPSGAERQARFRASRKEKQAVTLDGETASEPLSASSSRPENGPVTARNGRVTPRNGPVTPPIEQRTDTDTEIKDSANSQTLSGSRRKARSPDRAPVDYPDEFLILWESFPRHPNASKHEACKAWRRLPPPDRDACLDGALAYGRFLAGERTKRPDYPALHLATFINQRRFENLLEAERAQCVN